MSIGPLTALGSGAHVFFSLLIIIACGYLLAELRRKEVDYRLIYNLSLAIAVLLWITWITAGWYYVLHYGVDKAVIKAGAMDWAHKVVMETKEHIFYTGLVLGTALPLAVHNLKEKIKKGEGKLIFHMILALIIGDLFLDLLGGAISIAAKYSWMIKAGG